MDMAAAVKGEMPFGGRWALRDDRIVLSRGSGKKGKLCE